MAASSATTDKYPASSGTPDYSHPELAPVMTRPPHQPLQTSQHYPGYSPQQHYQYHNGYPGEAKQSALQPQQKRNPWGLSPLAFGLLVAALTAAIVGGAVGGGVGGAMSSKDNDSSSNATTTVTVTPTSSTPTRTDSSSSTTASSLPLPSSLKNYVAAEPMYVDSLANPWCPSSTTQQLTVQGDATFSLFCNVDWGNHAPDKEDPSLTVADTVGLFAYSIEDCLDACTNQNSFVTEWGQDGVGGNMQGCKGITWHSDMAQQNSSYYANCWLKNGTTTPGFLCDACVSARLNT